MKKIRKIFRHKEPTLLNTKEFKILTKKNAKFSRIFRKIPHNPINKYFSTNLSLQDSSFRNDLIIFIWLQLIEPFHVYTVCVPSYNTFTTFNVTLSCTCRRALQLDILTIYSAKSISKPGKQWPLGGLQLYLGNMLRLFEVSRVVQTISQHIIDMKNKKLFRPLPRLSIFSQTVKPEQ